MYLPIFVPGRKIYSQQSVDIWSYFHQENSSTSSYTHSGKQNTLLLLIYYIRGIIALCVRFEVRQLLAVCILSSFVFA